MIVQREVYNFALARVLQTIAESELEKALEPYLKKPEPRLLKTGKQRPFRPFKAVRMTNQGPAASEMVIQDRF